MKHVSGNDLDVGKVVGAGVSLIFPRESRSKHLYICGTTGTGKSKFLEHLIRQDIMAWPKSKCGLLLLDPHGGLYDNLIRWSTWLNLDRPIIPIDLRRDDWGQASLDLSAALEKGAIILVNLSTETAAISTTNADRFAAGLLNDLWTAARGRGKHGAVKPFYIYLDEFHRFVTPTFTGILDQGRGFGLHLTMAHQLPGQLRNRGANGKRVYDSVMENASSKIVFRLNDKEDRDLLTECLFTGVMGAPVSISPPTVNQVPGSAERTKRYLKKLHQKLPSAIRGEKVRPELPKRKQAFKEQFLKKKVVKPIKATRRGKVKKKVKKAG